MNYYIVGSICFIVGFALGGGYVCYYVKKEAKRIKIKILGKED